MTRFRPCIDLHDGRVKQIVGSTLVATGEAPRENFVSEHDAAYYAQLYARDALMGGHVIKLGQGNEAAALSALAAYPGGLQLGGGVTPDNAASYLAAGASHVIVTSYCFDADGHFREERLARLVAETGREKLVLDLSCRAVARGTEFAWIVAMNRWQTATDLAVDHATLDFLAAHCAEFLIHAVDVEGKCEGIDEPLVRYLGDWGKRPITYAGGARSLDDLRLVDQASAGRIDVTIGSALDLFGGASVCYSDCVAFNRR